MTGLEAIFFNQACNYSIMFVSKLLKHVFYCSLSCTPAKLLPNKNWTKTSRVTRLIFSVVRNLQL